MFSSSSSKKEAYMGYRFCPVDEELVTYYLLAKARGLDLPSDIIGELDLYSYNPDELPKDEFDNKEAYFFTQRPNSYQQHIATTHGYWKMLGDKKIVHDEKVIGSKTKMIFYSGTPPNAQKTGYLMEEYRLDSSWSANEQDDTIRENIQTLVVCKVQIRVANTAKE